MIKIQNFFLSCLLIFSSILILTFIIIFFNYFNILPDSIISIINIIIIFISSLIGGFFLGTKSNKGGYKNGIILGLIYSIFLIIINLIFFDFKIKYLLFYSIIIISTMLGSMVGIQKNRK